MFQWRINFNLAVQDAPDIIGMTEAVHVIARAIARIPLTPATQERLHRLNIMRAVRGTTGIEGVDLTDEEVDEIISSPEGLPVLPRARAREEMEARAAHNLFMRVENVLQDDIGTELTEALICEFHEILSRDIDYRGNTPGEYRKRQVHVDTYEPPEHTEIPELMTRFIEWLNRGAGAHMDPVARAVVAHFLLVSIHPVWRREWPVGSWRGEFSVVQGRRQCSRLLFLVELLLSGARRIYRRANQRSVPIRPRRDAVRPIRIGGAATGA